MNGKYQMIKKAWGGISASAITDQGHSSSMSGGFRLLLEVARHGDEGCTVIVAPHEDGPRRAKWIRHAVSGPMLDLQLAPDAHQPFNREDLYCLPAMAMATSGENGYGALVRLAIADREFGGFDDVGLAVFEQLAVAAGARVGHKRGDAIVWIDGHPDTPLPPADVENRETPDYRWLSAENDLVPFKPEQAVHQ